MDKVKSPNEFNTLMDVVSYFKDEKTCIEYLEQWRWKGIVRCIYCGSAHIYTFKNCKHYKCAGCREHFTITTGTIFHSTKLPLSKWLAAVFLVGSLKKGISSYQLAKLIGVQQRTAWFMTHRIRKLLQQENIQLEGVVSSDEAFVGGKNKNRHKSKKIIYKSGRDFSDKTPVIGMIEKGGRLKTKVIPDVQGKTIREAVLETIKPESVLVTDEYKGYHRIGKYYKHKVVDHSRGMYSNAEGYTTNDIEGFWSHLKRMIIGVYHQVSRKHLQKYMDELTFRYNTRKEKEGVRFAMMMSRIDTRLSYKQLVYGKN